MSAPTGPGFDHFSSTEHICHPAQAEIGITPFPDKLYVVTMLSNPLRWRSRYKNYWKFERECHCAGAELYTAEVAFGHRPFEITSPDNPHHLQLRTHDEIWHKENALNLLIQRLPSDAKYVAWVDADVAFTRKDWAQETLHLLQHYDFIQMFSYAQDLNFQHEPLGDYHRGFMAQYLETLDDPLDPKTVGDDEAKDSYYYGQGTRPASAYWHPGFAWAARIDSLEKVGMLIDWAILGSADWHMAWGLIGMMEPHMQPKLSYNYRRMCMEWQERAEREVQHNVGFMPGLLFHYFHGSKKKRHYGDRWKFLIDANFDPVHDLKRDRQGLWKLNGTNKRLRDGIRTYARIRDEDDRY